MIKDSCRLCPRLCGKTRTSTDVGICGVSLQPKIARATLHFGEEPCISGTKGSGTVFFSGCPLRCRFCQNHTISQEGVGKTVTIERLAAIFRELEAAGAHNINLVNPTHYATAIREALDLYRPSIPIVYNSSGYERVETLQMLDGYIDIYLPDCKYIHTDIAASLSRAGDYFAHAAPAILEMARQTGPVQLNEQGIAQNGTIVRHLVLPGHTKESMAVLDWLATIKDKVWVSLMLQYTPMGDLENHKELQRPLTRRECEKIWLYMQELGITDGYIQDRASTGTNEIPSFDLTGV